MESQGTTLFTQDDHILSNIYRDTKNGKCYMFSKSNDEGILLINFKNGKKRKVTNSVFNTQFVKLDTAEYAKSQEYNKYIEAVKNVLDDTISGNTPDYFTVLYHQMATVMRDALADATTRESEDYECAYEILLAAYMFKISPNKIAEMIVTCLCNEVPESEITEEDLRIVPHPGDNKKVINTAVKKITKGVTSPEKVVDTVKKDEGTYVTLEDEKGRTREVYINDNAPFTADEIITGLSEKYETLK